jgi:hypothetical protein
LRFAPLEGLVTRLVGQAPRIALGCTVLRFGQLWIAFPCSIGPVCPVLIQIPALSWIVDSSAAEAFVARVWVAILGLFSGCVVRTVGVEVFVIPCCDEIRVLPNADVIPVGCIGGRVGSAATSLLTVFSGLCCSLVFVGFASRQSWFLLSTSFFGCAGVS